MTNIVCKTGSVLIDEQCFSVCPSNFISIPTDNTLCVSNIACPINTTEVDYINCQKSVENAQNGTCSRGAQWAPDLCYYPNCPAPFLENGFSCTKRSVPRTVSQPYCSNILLSFDGNTCSSLSLYGWLLLLLAVIVAFGIGYTLYNSQTCPKPAT
jgi:hypothetical protein